MNKKTITLLKNIQNHCVGEFAEIVSIKRKKYNQKVIIQPTYQLYRRTIYADNCEVGFALRILRINKDTIRIAWMNEEKNYKIETIPVPRIDEFNDHDKKRKFIVKEILEGDYSNELLAKFQNGDEIVLNNDEWMEA